MNDTLLTPVLLYQDSDFCVIDKPFGMTTTPDRDKASLVQWAADSLRMKTLHPLSRLDFEVTGAVLFAKSAYAIAHAHDIRGRQNDREYHALVHPAPSENAHWRWPIGKDKRRPERRLIGGIDPQDAHTEMTLAETRGGFAWLRLTPHTGRTHQLRLHSAHAGCPTVGDVVYGGLKRVTLRDGRVIAAGRVMLHAANTVVPNGPRVEAPWREDMRLFWEALASLSRPTE
ncbi:MAG: RNA pseudouridine synthase [Deltaproteobacteria bacterium]|nr:RNA pseudouridine synthase [Deltaproteobacteria bacterium]